MRVVCHAVTIKSAAASTCRASCQVVLCGVAFFLLSCSHAQLQPTRTK